MMLDTTIAKAAAAEQIRQRLNNQIISRYWHVVPSGHRVFHMASTKKHTTTTAMYSRHSATGATPRAASQ